MLDDLVLAQTYVKQGLELWNLWKETVATKPHLPLVDIALVGKYTALPDSKYLLGGSIACPRCRY